MPRQSIWEFEGDSSSAVEAVDRMVEAIDELIDAIGVMGASAEELGALDESLAGLGESAQAAVADTTELALAIADATTLASEGIEIEQFLAEAIDLVGEAASATAAQVEENGILLGDFESVAQAGIGIERDLAEAVDLVGAALADSATFLNDDVAVMGALGVPTAEAAAATDLLSQSLTALLDASSEGINIEKALSLALEEVGAAAETAATQALINAEAMKEMGVSAETADEDEKAAGDDASFAATGFFILAMALQQIISGFVGLGISAQDSITRITALTSDGQTNMQGYASGLEALSLQLGSTLSDTADGMYYVASAGFTAAKGGLTVLKYAMMDARASGADVATTADALTSALNAYNATSQDAAQYSNYMIEAVVQGKQTFSEFANAIGAAAVTGNTVGISFDQVAAAEATMTDSGLSARRSVMDLDFLMRAIALNVDTVATTASGLGLAFDKNAYSSMNLIQKLQYLQQISGGNKTEFEKLVGGANGLLAAQILLNGGGEKYNEILNKIQHSQNATTNAFAVSQQTISAHVGHLVADFSVLAYKVVEWATPYVVGIIDAFSKAIGTASDWIQNHLQLAIPILAALAAVIGGVLVAALISILAPLGAVIASAAPVVGIVAAVVAAIAGLVPLIKHLWDTSAGFRNLIGQLVDGFKHFLNAVEPVWETLKGSLMQAFKEVGDVVKNQIIPSWNMLVNDLKPALPLFQFLGMVIGFILLTAIALFVGALNGLAKAIGPIIHGVATIIGGLVEFVSGVIEVLVGIFGGLFNVINDLIHGHTDRIGKDLQNAWKAITDGVGKIVMGLVHAVVGAFQGLVGGVWGLLSGFVGGVINFFKGLFEKLVGHSIVLDMIAGIIKAFLNMPAAVYRVLEGWVLGVVGFALKLLGQFLDAIEALRSGSIDKFKHIVSQIIDEVSKLPDQLLHWGEEMINSFIKGIMNKVGDVKNAIGNVANAIAGFFHHSHPDEGPLAKDYEWMEHFGDMLAAGLASQAGKVRAAANQLATSVSGNQFGSVGGAPGIEAMQAIGAGGPLGGGGSSNVLYQILAALQQGNVMPRIGPAPTPAAIGSLFQTFGINISGSNKSALDLYNEFTILAGQAQENAARGANVGLPF